MWRARNNLEITTSLSMFKMMHLILHSCATKKIPALLDPQIEYLEKNFEPQESDDNVGEKKIELISAKYVRRHHSPDQIVRDKMLES